MEKLFALKLNTITKKVNLFEMFSLTDVKKVTKVPHKRTPPVGILHQAQTGFF